MNVPINFAQVLAGAAPLAADRIPAALNGRVHAINVARPVDNINSNFLLVLTAGHEICQLDSIALAIKMASGIAAAGPTAAGAELAVPRIMRIVIQCVILGMFSHTPVVITMRPGDLMSQDAFVALNGAAINVYRECANKVYAALMANQSAMAVHAACCVQIGLAIVANAIHRRKCDGHNWFTDKTLIARSETNRICNIAGAGKVEFAAFMVVNGHDLWHFLADSTIYDMASALCRTNPLIVAGAFTMGGVAYQDSPAHVVLDLGPAVISRYPVSQNGIAGMIKGLDCLMAMINDIQTKVVLGDMSSFQNGIIYLKHDISTVPRTAEEVRTMKTSLAPVAITAYGYCTGSPSLNEAVGESEALEAYGRMDAVAFLFGKTIAARMREIDTDVEAISSMLETFLSQAAEAMEGLGVAGHVGVPAEVITANQKKAEKANEKADLEIQELKSKVLTTVRGTTVVDFTNYTNL